MKMIPLSMGRVAMVGDDDYEELSKYKWSISTGSQKDSYYAYRTERVNGKDKPIAMQRQIMNCPIGMIVDHINHNTLDNRKDNLRVVTNQQNSCNRRGWKNSRSGYKGVTWYSHNRGWRSQITINGKVIVIGYFFNPLEAALAYDRAAVEYHGEYAYLNFDPRGI